MDETTAPEGLAEALADSGVVLAGPVGAGAGGPRWTARGVDGSRWTVTVVVPRSPAHSADVSARARRLADVEHAHLPAAGPVLELSGGRVVILHAHVDGADLLALSAARGPWRPGEVVTVLVPLADALAALHGAGLAHGDVSPANVVVAPDGRPFLVDLLCGVDPYEAGTPGFAAPERPRGALPAADVHALGRLGLVLLGEAGPGVAREFDDAQRSAVREVLAGAVDRDPSRRPDAASFAAQLYAACPPVPVEMPEPGALARCALRRLADAGAAGRTEPRASRTARARGRRARRRRARLLTAAAAGAVGLLGVSISAVVAAGPASQGSSSPSDGAVGPAPGGAGASGGVLVLAPLDVAPQAAAVRLTYRHAQAVARGDAALLRAVTEAGSPAALADARRMPELARTGPASAATDGGSMTVPAPGVTIAVDHVALLPGPARARDRASSPALPGTCARVQRSAALGLNVATGDADVAPPAPDAGGDVAAAPDAAPVVLTLCPTPTGWRVREVASAGT